MLSSGHCSKQSIRILNTILAGSHYYSRFTDRETEARRGSVMYLFKMEQPWVEVRIRTHASWFCISNRNCWLHPPHTLR